jgi:hypothetical protein
MGILCECGPYWMWWLETLQPLNVTSIQNLNVIDQVDVGQELDFGWRIFNCNARSK